MPDIPENNGSQVIARAATIFNVLETEPGGMTIAQLAKQTGLPRTTVHRLVSSLESQQLLSFRQGEVRLGPALARLAAAAHTDIVPLARPAMETLNRRTRETVDLSIFRGTHAISVSQIISDRELRVVSPVGTAFPCHCTAHGKALLSLFPDEKILSLTGNPPERRTGQTLKTPEAVLQNIQLCRDRQYALDNEEHAEGVCGLGMVLKTGLTEQYALSLAVPVARFMPNLPELLSAIRQCKAEIESVLVS